MCTHIHTHTHTHTSTSRKLHHVVVDRLGLFIPCSPDSEGQQRAANSWVTRLDVHRYMKQVQMVSSIMKLRALLAKLIVVYQIVGPDFYLLSSPLLLLLRVPFGRVGKCLAERNPCVYSYGQRKRESQAA